MAFHFRIKLEQFHLAESQDGKCSEDSFSISIQQSGGDRMDMTGLLCGQKTGLESKEKDISHGKHIVFVSVLLPVTQRSIVYFNFDIGTDEAIWRLKIAKEDCSENSPTSLLGEMTC
jgi:hypothetical protein